MRSDCDDAVHTAGFDPGGRLRAVREGFDEDGDPIVAVWDADGLYRAGTLRLMPRHASLRRSTTSPCVDVILLEESRTALE